MKKLWLYSLKANIKKSPIHLTHVLIPTYYNIKNKCDYDLICDEGSTKTST